MSENAFGNENFSAEGFWGKKTFTTLGWVKKWISKNKPNLPTHDELLQQAGLSGVGSVAFRAAWTIVCIRYMRPLLLQSLYFDVYATGMPSDLTLRLHDLREEWSIGPYFI